MQPIELNEVKPDYMAKTAYRTIRKQIEALGEDFRVVAVTSCARKEGKSTVAYHLARAFAESGMNTLLLDADLHHSDLRRVRKKGIIKWGLSHALIGQLPFEGVLCQTDLENLDIVFAGPAMRNPSKALTNDRFIEILRRARKAYHCVIVDTPPIGILVDAAVVARLCDGMLLVVESGNVSGRFIKKAKKQLERAGCRILGVVLNEIKVRRRNVSQGADADSA